MDGFEWNKVAAGSLLAAVVALGAYIVSGEVFREVALEKPAIDVPVVEASATAAVDAGPQIPLEQYLAQASIEKGERTFKKCIACHNVDKGGANQTGPNLYGIVGKTHAHAAGFGYSAAMQATAGKTWDWAALNHWFESPKKYIPGNKMSFAGISKPQERADLLAFLNSKSDAPLPMPAVPAVEAAAPSGEAAAAAVPAPASAPAAAH